MSTYYVLIETAPIDIKEVKLQSYALSRNGIKHHGILFRFCFKTLIFLQTSSKPNSYGKKAYHFDLLGICREFLSSPKQFSWMSQNERFDPPNVSFPILFYQQT